MFSQQFFFQFCEYIYNIFLLGWMLLDFETIHYYNQLILLKMAFSEVPTPVKK